MAALGFQQYRPNALYGTLGLKHPREWQLRPTPTEEPKCAVVNAPQLHGGPPCFPQKRPVYL